jgi:uncharacterized repeat protein (TIGR01451 family)
MKTQQADLFGAVRRLSNILLFGVLLAFILPVGARAAGTPADTDINNMATINYSVGGGSTITIESSPTGNTTIGAGNGTATMFEVDRKVDLTVTRVAGSYTDVPANGDNVVLTYTVANTGNATLDFGLETLNMVTGFADPYGGSDGLDVTIVGVFVDSDGPGSTDGSYVPGDHSYDTSDTATTVDDLPQDQMINVYVVVDIPNTAVNGQVAVMLLRATGLEPDGSTLSETSGGDTIDAVDTVFADDDADGAGTHDIARNGRDLDTDAFRIQAAGLTVTKTSVVVSDPFNLTSNPKAIPGATVAYTITIANAAGVSTAAGVTITDDLSALVSGSPSLMAFLDDGYSVGHGIRVTAPDIGTDIELSNAADGDQGDWDGSIITVNCGDLDAGETAMVTFQLVIN